MIFMLWGSGETKQSDTLSDTLSDALSDTLGSLPSPQLGKRAIKLTKSEQRQNPRKIRNFLTFIKLEN